MSFLSVSVSWKACLLFWDSIGWSCSMWVCRLAGEVSSGDRFLCFHFTVGLSVHQDSSLCGLCPFTGETFLRRGDYRTSWKDINTTKKITEHITEGYHIDSLIQIEECYDTLRAMLFLTMSEMLHHQKNGACSLFILFRNQSSNSIAWECVRALLTFVEPKEIQCSSSTIHRNLTCS